MGKSPVSLKNKDILQLQGMSEAQLRLILLAQDAAD